MEAGQWWWRLHELLGYVALRYPGAPLADLACMTGGPPTVTVAVCLAAGLGARGGNCAQLEVRTPPAAVPAGVAGWLAVLAG